MGTLNRLNNKERHCLQLQAVPFFVLYMDYNIMSTMLSASAVGFCTSSPLMSRA